MKTKVLIIEDNYYKYFTTKQVLESQLKMSINVVGVRTSSQLVETTIDINPDLIMFRPHGGVAELLTKMKKRNTNRRNTEITLLMTEDFDDEMARKFEEFVASQSRSVPNAA